MSQLHMGAVNVEVASEELDEKGRNTYIITRDEEEYGFYIAGPGLGTDHSNHNDLKDEYADSSEVRVESLGAVNFGHGDVIFVSDNFRSEMELKELEDWEQYRELEEEILDAVEDKVDIEYELEAVKWR